LSRLKRHSILVSIDYFSSGLRYISSRSNFHFFCSPQTIIIIADNTSLNNNNNNNSLNNNTVVYHDKSTQTTAAVAAAAIDSVTPGGDCEDSTQQQQQQQQGDSAVERMSTETQTDFSNLHSESICCLSAIPFADHQITSSPPPINYSNCNANNASRTSETCNNDGIKLASNINENFISHELNNRHNNNNHVGPELNQLSARTLPYTIDTSIAASTQAAMAIVGSGGGVGGGGGGGDNNGDVHCKANDNCDGL